jgi:hypothetical protein
VKKGAAIELARDWFLSTHCDSLLMYLAEGRPRTGARKTVDFGGILE